MHDTLGKVTELAGSAATTSDMSILSLISNADLVVKLVLLILFIASLISWAIIFEKLATFSSLFSKATQFEKVFWSGQLLDQLYERIKTKADHPLAIIFVSAMHEWIRSDVKRGNMTDGLRSSIKERLYQVMNMSINKEMDKVEGNIGMLAITASISPFIGLLGTVWGIMHSFQSIAISKNTTLAVVAPGIAEALFATAIGLFAAIPAAIFYNILNKKLNNLNSRLDDFSNELGTLLTRELDQE
jgi:biopolymer transport protein TolQ